MANSFGRITDHLVDALEVTPPALLPTVLPFWVPPPFHHAGEAAHVEFRLGDETQDWQTSDFC
jgi:hypothetical protein